MGTGMPPRRWPLVGREAQLAVFDEVWADPAHSGFVIFGPAGVGKSRLADECLARAGQAGRCIRRVVATAAAARVPLGAVAHLLPYGANLSDPVSAFAAAARSLSQWCDQRQPVILLVDDLQLLDATSTMLLRQLLDANVIFLLGTVRTGMRRAGGGGALGADAVTALAHGDAVHQLDLTEFNVREVETLLQRVLGGAVDRRTAHDLYAASNGNPLYLRELVQGALAAGTLVSDGEIWGLTSADQLHVTRRLTDLIRHRLSGSSSASRWVLDTLALCEPLSVTHLAAEAEPGVLDALERSELVVSYQEGRRTLLRLAHALYGDVLRADMSALRRRELLLQQVVMLEKNGARRREDAMHLASYQLTVTGTADPALLLQGAVLASHARDHPRVLTFLRAVPKERRDFPVALLLGRTLLEVGDVERAEAALAEAEALASDEEEALTAVLIRTQNLIWGVGAALDMALAANDRARDRVSSPVGRRMLRVNEACIRFSLGDLVGCLPLIDDLEFDAADAPQTQMWLMAATTKAVALAYLGRGPEAVRWAERAVAVCSAVGTDEYALATDRAAIQSVLVLALTESGRLEEARALGEQVYAELTGTHADLPRVLLAFQLGRTAWVAGHPVNARRWYAEVARATRPQAMIARTLALGGLAASAALQGDVQAAQTALAEHATVHRAVYVPEERLGVAWLHVARGELTLAREVLAEAAGEARERGQTSSEVLLLTDLARLGRARDVVDRLAELARDPEVSPLIAVRSRLVAALAANEPVGLMAVVEELEAIGAHLLAAEAASAAVALWERAGKPRCSAAAAARSAANADHCQQARTPGLMMVNGIAALTRREQEIALLASQGMLSKDIATHLTISVRTVDNHLQRVYSKLGITNRRQLATCLNH